MHWNVGHVKVEGGEGRQWDDGWVLIVEWRVPTERWMRSSIKCHFIVHGHSMHWHFTVLWYDWMGSIMIKWDTLLILTWIKIEYWVLSIEYWILSSWTWSCIIEYDRYHWISPIIIHHTSYIIYHAWDRVKSDTIWNRVHSCQRERRIIRNG